MKPEQPLMCNVAPPDREYALLSPARASVLGASILRVALMLAMLLSWMTIPAAGKTYGSGGRSFSSSKSSSPSRSFRSAASSKPSGSGKSFSSSSGRTYSSGASPATAAPAVRSYSSGAKSGKSYTSSPASPTVKRENPPRKADAPASRFTFDTGAARAQKESTSKRDFSSWKSANEVPKTASNSRGNTYASPYQRPVFQESPQAYRTRTTRIEHVYRPYYARPMVYYHDPYHSFFWWWLLDRSLEERSLWAYHHRYDMDTARYQALVDSDAALRERVRQLELQQTAVNPNYVPSGIDTDLMYNDQYVHRAYSSHRTAGGRFFFWLVMIPTMMGMIWLLVWLIFIKRWYSATPQTA